MGSSITGGLLLLIGIGVMFAVIAFVAYSRPEPESSDLEHFDHEPGDSR